MARVTVTEGELEGELIQNPCGGSYYSFKGIPYAEPPLGDLRFKTPLTKLPWQGVRSAKEHGPEPFQYDFIVTKSIIGNEDCLYLNVYTPELHPNQPLPVMFYIYGGNFTSGSGNTTLYNPEFLIRHEVIIVTFNYRNGAFGFLSLDTEDIPGNAGMKDQVAALRWVNKNIQQFGGDADNITIFGDSTGAACVSYHLVSPMSKGLFHRAICQSGSALNSWAQAFEARERARAFAKQLGLDSNDDKELYEFFKYVPPEKLVKLNAKLTFSELARVSRNRHLAIVCETQFGNTEAFFYGDINEAFRNGIHDGVEVMVGYSEHEGYCGLIGIKITEIIHQANNFLQAFTPTDFIINCSESNQLKVGRIFKEYYYNNKKNTLQEGEPVINFMSVDVFVYKIVQMLKFCAKRNKTYMYKFTCKSERNIVSDFLGLKEIIGNKQITTHADILSYLFNLQMCPVDINSVAFKYIENVGKLWTNFAKHGDPTPDDSLGVRWAPYSLQQQHYLDIGQELVSGTAPDSEEIAFWDRIYRQYLPSHLAE